jgi:NhaP-type Na+/H+ or K+/H+ antiporter
MIQDPLTGLVTILLLGVAAQWVALRLKLPSILVLLLVGMAVGPLLGWIDPEVLLGDLLGPVVSVSVALILLEGGLSLRQIEIVGAGAALLRLCTIALLINWGVVTVLAATLAGLPWPLATLFGAILTVTGPTVIGPLLRQIRPTGPGAALVKWEGILTDPIGALLAVLVFEAIVSRQSAESVLLEGIAHSFAAGLGTALGGAAIIWIALKRHIVPDALEAAFVTAVAIGSWFAANTIHEESGLITVTVMGLLLANQRSVPLGHVVEFKENLRIFLVGILFVLLAASITMEDLETIDLGAFAFLLALIVIARPATVLAGTLFSAVPWKDRLFMMAVAPRGIVAASVASVFALRLDEAGVEDGARIAPLMFLVIIGTVAFYGSVAGPLARRLGLAQRDPQGLLMIGASPFSRLLARALKARGHAVLLVDTNFQNVTSARLEGLAAWHGSVLGEDSIERLPLAGLGRALALTPNDEANSLSALRCSEIFGRSEVYQLAPDMSSAAARHRNLDYELRGRLLFSPQASYRALLAKAASGHEVKATLLTREFDHKAFLAKHPEALVLLVEDSSRRLRIATDGQEPKPLPGETVFHLSPLALPPGGAA